MSRVASAMHTIGDLAAGRLAPAAAKEVIRATSQAPLAPTWLFTLAAAAAASELRRSTSSRGGSHIHDCGCRRRSSPRLGALQRKRHPATIRRGLAGWRYRGAGGSIPVELVAAPRRSLPMHGPGTRTTRHQWRVGSRHRRVHLGVARIVFAGLVVMAISTGYCSDSRFWVFPCR
jgi:hypothetical protein